MKNPPLNNAPSFVNMRELVEYIDQKYATRIAYSFRKNPHDDEIQTRSYARLCEDVRCIAAAAAERGIPQAGHCALIGKRSDGWVCTYLALLSVGAVLVPLDPDCSAEDLTDTVGKAECTSLFCSDDVFAHKASAITEATGIKTIVTIDYAESDCTLEDLVAEGKALRENGSAAYESARIHPDELALLVFTSGTTGKGKGVMLSQTAILSNITAGLQLITLNTDKTIGLLPPHHTFGSTINILGNLLYGVNMYISSGARYVAAELKEQKPEVAQRLLSLGREVSEIRKANNISLSSVSIKYPFWSRVLKSLVLLLKLPYNIPVTILTLPIKLVCAFLFTKLKDYAFRNSVRYLVNLVLWPVLMLIYSIIAFVVLPWPWALLVIALLLPAPIVAHETYRLIRVMVSDMRLLLNKDLRNKYNEIREIIFNE